MIISENIVNLLSTISKHIKITQDQVKNGTYPVTSNKSSVTAENPVINEQKISITINIYLQESINGLTATPKQDKIVILDLKKSNQTIRSSEYVSDDDDEYDNSGEGKEHNIVEDDYFELEDAEYY